MDLLMLNKMKLKNHLYIHLILIHLYYPNILLLLYNLMNNYNLIYDDDTKDYISKLLFEYLYID